MNLFGRTKIYTSHSINVNNVVQEVNKSLIVHFKNRDEEDFLYQYSLGDQPILNRTKEIRPEINNKVVENIASEIIAFKNGYFLTKPTFYVSRREDEELADKIKDLNDFLYVSGKQDADNKLVNWFHTVGLGVLYVEQNDDDEEPFSIYALDPRNSYVVYSTRAGEKPIMGIHIVNVTDGDEVKYVFDVYTKTQTFTLSGGEVVDENGNTQKGSCCAYEVIDYGTNILGEIPIIEYQYDFSRMSAYEKVMPLLDCVNETESDRANGIQQFIQSLMVFYNCQLGEDDNGNAVTPAQIREYGAIFLKSVGQDKADLKILNEQLDQAQSQIFVDNLKNAIYDIAGVPFNSHDMKSTSDNVGAVYLRNGYAMADTQARNTEDLFKESNKLVDKIILKILKIKQKVVLKASDIAIQFSRNEMDNPLVKTQTALNLKSIGLSPELVLEKSGISSDPSGDVAKSKEYIDRAFSGEDTTQVSTNEDINPTEGNGTVQDEGSKGGVGTPIKGYYQQRGDKKIWVKASTQKRG